METDDAAPDSQNPPADGDDNNDNNGDAPTSAPQPPPPAPPVVPGPRATRFQELYAQSLKRTLAKLKWDNFAACYPTVASKAEPVLKQVQTQMAEKLAEKCEVWALKQ
jgi:kinetochore protein NNF1